VQVLKGPSKAILDSSVFDEAILVFVYKRRNYSLEPIGKDLVMIFIEQLRRELGL